MSREASIAARWWGDGTVVEEMDVRPGGTYHVRTAQEGAKAGFASVDALLQQLLETR